MEENQTRTKTIKEEALINGLPEELVLALGPELSESLIAACENLDRIYTGQKSSLQILSEVWESNATRASYVKGGLVGKKTCDQIVSKDLPYFDRSALSILPNISEDERQGMHQLVIRFESAGFKPHCDEISIAIIALMETKARHQIGNIIRDLSNSQLIIESDEAKKELISKAICGETRIAWCLNFAFNCYNREKSLANKAFQNSEFGLDYIKKIVFLNVKNISERFAFLILPESNIEKLRKAKSTSSNGVIARYLNSIMIDELYELHKMRDAEIEEYNLQMLNMHKNIYLYNLYFSIDSENLIFPQWTMKKIEILLQRIYPEVSLYTLPSPYEKLSWDAISSADTYRLRAVVNEFSGLRMVSTALNGEPKQVKVIQMTHNTVSFYGGKKNVKLVKNFQLVEFLELVYSGLIHIYDLDGDENVVDMIDALKNAAPTLVTSEMQMNDLPEIRYPSDLFISRRHKTKEEAQVSFDYESAVDWINEHYLYLVVQSADKLKLKVEMVKKFDDQYIILLQNLLDKSMYSMDALDFLYQMEWSNNIGILLHHTHLQLLRELKNINIFQIDPNTFRRTANMILKNSVVMDSSGRLLTIIDVGLMEEVNLSGHIVKLKTNDRTGKVEVLLTEDFLRNLKEKKYQFCITS